MPLATVPRNSFVLVLMGYRASIVRYIAGWGCRTAISGPIWVNELYQGGVSQLLGVEQISRNMGNRNDSLAISRDMRPL